MNVENRKGFIYDTPVDCGSPDIHVCLLISVICRNILPFFLGKLIENSYCMLQKGYFHWIKLQDIFIG